MLPKFVSPVFHAVTKAYEGKAICRALITTLARELGTLPEVTRMVREFGDYKQYPTRPMITLRESNPAIYLLGWREGDFTDVHDHGDCEVGIYVVQGVVTEDIYTCAGRKRETNRRLIATMSRELSEGQCTTCLQTYVHRMGNIFPEVAATLHVYGPTLEDMCLYDQGANGQLYFKEHWHQAHKAQH